MKQDARTDTNKSAIQKRLSEQSKLKSGNLTQKIQDLRHELEGIRDKANNEVDNLKSLLNVDAAKKEMLENRVKTLENRVVNLDHEYAEATEEVAVSLVVEHLFSYFLLLYLPNV